MSGPIPQFIPVCGSIIFHLYTSHFVYPLICWWTFWLFTVNGVMNISVHVFIWALVFSILGYIRRSGVSGSYGNSMFNLTRTHQTLPMSLHVPLPVFLSERGQPGPYAHSRLWPLAATFGKFLVPSAWSDTVTWVDTTKESMVTMKWFLIVFNGVTRS